MLHQDQSHAQSSIILHAPQDTGGPVVLLCGAAGARNAIPACHSERDTSAHEWLESYVFLVSAFHKPYGCPSPVEGASK